MSTKKLKGDGIFFTGKASDEVTGSQYLIKFGGRQILLECGLHQSSSNSYLDSYKINADRFRFKPAEIDYVFVAHAHIDHSGLLPRLVKEGFKGRIIATGKTASVIKPLLLNSCYILNDEAKVLSKRYKREYSPIYEEKDVYEALDIIYEYDEYRHIYKLDDVVSFQWLPNAHCVGAAQLQLILTADGKKKKILYTSDIGALHTKNHYVEDTEIPSGYNDVVLMESTYGNARRSVTKTREQDTNHLISAINTVLERGGSVILPCFSFSRTQEMLTTLYSIYGKDEKFRTPVIVDSKLSCDISDLYSGILEDSDRELWESVKRWGNVRFISEKADSQACVADNGAKIILSASGFCTNGRVVNYLKKYIADRKSMVIFSGYTGDNPSYLSYRIKNYREHKYISINKERVANLADCITLSSFSSHAGHEDLVEYGSSLNCGKLILVHGEAESKKCLAEKLKDAISKKDKTYRVLCAFRGMVVHL